MRHALFIFAFLGIVSSSRGDNFVMRDFGMFDHKDDEYSVRIELVEGANNGLAPKFIFNENGRESSTGIGKGHFISVIPKQWAAVFRPPHELWIYDGKGALHLYERTMNPSGFKSSSSTVVPELFSQAPEELKKLIAESVSK